ncbi:MAG: His/Gly/Thr/Pro-type tRNA ligase C-terminal domain-containing protein, partial [Cytophaga sp.]|uniref:His/Gly/Thr/Pro-type tRNA ligase C-terminal domain-containing protein n=1 Tax=Cytophaga sp. TaxID=29535 RepID=UPI003F7E9CB8
ILPISDKFNDYAQEVYDRLLVKDIRGFVDSRDEKIGKKIRDTEVKKVPYMLVIGEKEVSEGKIAIRKHGGEDMGSILVEDFIQYFESEIAKQLAV